MDRHGINLLHKRMVNFIVEEKALLTSLQPATWVKFKNFEAGPIADEYTPIDLVNIFRDEVWPNMGKLVKTDPSIRDYIGDVNMRLLEPVIPETVYQRISQTDLYEAVAKSEKEKDVRNVTDPEITNQFLSFSYYVSTRAEIDLGKILSIRECKRRLHYIQKAIRNGASIKEVDPADFQKFYETVTSAHKLARGKVRMSDVISSNEETLSVDNPPQILSPPVISTEGKKPHCPTNVSQTVDTSNMTANLSVVNLQNRTDPQGGTKMRASMPAVDDVSNTEMTVPVRFADVLSSTQNFDSVAVSDGNQFGQHANAASYSVFRSHDLLNSTPMNLD